MSAKKAKPADTSSALKNLLFRGRWILVGVLVFSLVGIGWRMAWNRVSDHVLADDDYRLSLRDIAITPPPAWIHADIKAEVFRDASLEGSLSILDDELNKRIANAFSLHPWVANVERVSKHHPASVRVHLTYRQPMAMVEVSGGLLPVDGEGVLLPSEDFSPAQAKSYPRISRVDSHPAGPVGTNWGDAHVAGGALIAKALGDRWQKMKLIRIHAPLRGGASEEVDAYTYELTTHAGTRILWGRPPGMEPTGEPPALTKLKALEQIVAAQGSLDGTAGALQIDLRRSNPSIEPRTAAQPRETQ